MDAVWTRGLGSSVDAAIWRGQSTALGRAKLLPGKEAKAERKVRGIRRRYFQAGTDRLTVQARAGLTVYYALEDDENNPIAMSSLISILAWPLGSCFPRLIGMASLGRIDPRPPNIT